MSAFLGPIHHRMYAKARSVHATAEEIACFSDAQGWTSGHVEALAAAWPAPQGDIEQVIDLSQIHGSLSALVDNAERSLAFACAPIVDRAEDLASHLESMGERAARQAGPLELAAAWNALDAAWLDGMPCDGLMSLVSNDPDEIVWSIDATTHPAVGYLDLRTAWMRGFARTLGFAFSPMGAGTFRLSTEV